MLRNLIIIILFLVWIVLGWKSCNDWSQCCSPDGTITTAEAAIESGSAVNTPIGTDKSLEAGDSDIKRETGPVMFNWGNTNAIFNSDWNTVKNQLSDQLGDNKILEITGFYSEEEGNSSNAENLGLARAGYLKSLLSGIIPAERISLTGRIRNANEGDESNPFVASQFDFKNPDIKEKIVEIADRIDIYFPLNSDQRIQDREIEQYLAKLADRLKSSKEKVQLTGHTDNIGTVEINLAMGQSRAYIIRDFLISKGVPSSQIVTLSKGETQPVASNATENGRARNRRTEVQIINS